MSSISIIILTLPVLKQRGFLDAGWGQFFQILEQYCFKHGIYSSKKHRQISYAACLSGVTLTGRTRTPSIPWQKAVGITFLKILKLALTSA
ncbi:MAG: hypothetical protein ACREPR_26915 [Brasilonema sp.]